MMSSAPMPPAKKLLVTGASGFLGWHICRAASATWQVVGTSFSNSTSIAGVETCSVDLRDGDSVVGLLDALRPDAVVHAGALSQPNACEEEPERSEAINVGGTRILAEWCGDHGIPMVFTSTDLVFDGEHAPYAESDDAFPISIYGHHKLAAEQAVLEHVPNGAVCRLPLMYGDRDGAPASFIGPWVEKLKRGEPLSLFEDEIRTPASAAAVAEGLLMVLSEGTRGVLHLGGRERISRYDFGLKLAAAFGLSVESIRRTKLADITMSAPRAADVSLDSGRAFSLGYDPGSIDTQLLTIRDSMLSSLAPPDNGEILA
jgi:dTDP-4-dehydrorhamnose reductase